MKININLELDGENLAECIDGLEKFRETVLADFNAAYEDLTTVQDEDNFAGTWYYDNYVLDVELD